MLQSVKNTMYDLQMFMGDSGTLTISNLPTDSDEYVLYFEVNGKQKVTKRIELHGQAVMAIDITVSDSKALGVGQWNYGVKLCVESVGNPIEDTYIPDMRVAPRATLTIKPQVVEGVD